TKGCLIANFATVPERLFQVCGKPLGCLLVHAIVRRKGTQIAEFLLSESGIPVELFSRCF
ncbi:TPA: hypothetical protein ACIYSE_005138, partial [Escherichia coli]